LILEEKRRHASIDEKFTFLTYELHTKLFKNCAPKILTVLHVISITDDFSWHNKQRKLKISLHLALLH